MKRILLILAIIMLLGCKAEVPTESAAYHIFQGEHKLHAISNRYFQSLEGSMSGFFLFVIGSVSGEIEQKETLLVTFAWENNRKEVIFTTLPINQIRLSFVDDITPKVKFRWKSSSYGADDEQHILQEHIIWAVIQCKRELWNPQFDLPLNKETKKEN